jgi:hypothetical protein
MASSISSTFTTTFTTIEKEEVLREAREALKRVHTVLLVDNSTSMGYSLQGGGTCWDRVKIFAENMATFIVRHSSQKFTVKLLNDLDPVNEADKLVLDSVPMDPHFQNAFQIDNAEQITALMQSSPRECTPGGETVFKLLERYVTEDANHAIQLPLNVIFLLDGVFDSMDRQRYPLRDVVGGWGVSVEQLSVGLAGHSPVLTRPMKDFSLTLLLMVTNNAADRSFRELDDKLVGKFFRDPITGKMHQLVGDKGDYRPYLPWGSALADAYNKLKRGETNDLMKLVAFLATSCIVKRFDSMDYV